MKRRFTINDAGELEDRDGNVLGRVVGLTLDVPTSSTITRPESASSADDGADGLLGGRGLKEGLSRGLKEGSSAAGAGSVFDAVAEVWAHYCRVMKPRHQGLDEQARKIVREALKVATLAECKQAIDGCARSDFHMARGKYAGGKRYNRLSQILKAKPASPRGPGRTVRENIDFFLDLAQKSGLQPGVPSALNEKVRRAKRAALDAAEFPGDAQVAERGREARVWLESQGWTVDVSQDPVRFTPPGDPA